MTTHRFGRCFGCIEAAFCSWRLFLSRSVRLRRFCTAPNPKLQYLRTSIRMMFRKCSVNFRRFPKCCLNRVYPINFSHFSSKCWLMLVRIREIPKECWKSVFVEFSSKYWETCMFFLLFLRRDWGAIKKSRKEENRENYEHLVPRPFTSNGYDQTR